MPTYLVFEAREVQPTPGATVQDANGRIVRYDSPTTEDLPIGYVCLGGVSAKTENAAAQAMIGATRRVGKYAIVEATFLDFGTALGADPKDRPTLNP